MSYRWTRVPQGEPPLDAFQVRLLPLADFFMALMWSRPGGLSLRTTWVTPATLALAGAASLLSLTAGSLAFVAGLLRGGILLWAAVIICLGLVIGCGSVTVYGFRQRLLSRAATRSAG